jgi:Fe2+ or Zn2+ uptake regulation protein
VGDRGLEGRAASSWASLSSAPARLISRPAPAERRRHRILALLEEDPTRLWRPRDIAAHFCDVTLDTMYRRLSRWAESGLIHKIGPGLYSATTWSPTPLQ